MMAAWGGGFMQETIRFKGEFFLGAVARDDEER